MKVWDQYGLHIKMGQPQLYTKTQKTKDTTQGFQGFRKQKGQKGKERGLGAWGHLPLCWGYKSQKVRKWKPRRVRNPSKVDNTGQYKIQCQIQCTNINAIEVPEKKKTIDVLCKRRLRKEMNLRWVLKVNRICVISKLSCLSTGDSELTKIIFNCSWVTDKNGSQPGVICPLGGLAMPKHIFFTTEGVLVASNVQADKLVNVLQDTGKCPQRTVKLQNVNNAETQVNTLLRGLEKLEHMSNNRHV